MASLVLHPSDKSWLPNNDGDLYTLLQTTGLAGPALPDRYGSGYFVGNRFLSLVTFMGCSPAIKLEPDDSQPDQEFCSIRLRLEKASPLLQVASRNSPPRCPHCRSVVEVESGDPVAETLMDCKQCGAKTPLYALNWRKTAGYARCFVEITGVYPQEALPTATLLNSLQEFSGCEWCYFYR